MLWCGVMWCVLCCGLLCCANLLTMQLLLCVGGGVRTILVSNGSFPASCTYNWATVSFEPQHVEHTEHIAQHSTQCRVVGCY